MTQLPDRWQPPRAEPYPASGPPYGQPYPPPPQVIVVQGPSTSGMAVASLVLGILGLLSSCCSFGIFSLGAIVLGHVALAETKSVRKSGHGMAVAGLVMGYVFFLPAILFSIWIVLGAGLSVLGV